MNTLDTIVSLAKRRGFIFPGSEIYGGLANSWDYGPLGTGLKNNIARVWWKNFVQRRDDMVGLDSSIITNPKVWEASGHVSNFNDPLVDCKKCKTRHRGDKLLEAKIGVEKTAAIPFEQVGKELNTLEIACPHCGGIDWTDARRFNLLFETQIGVVDDAKNKAYLRGETAQGIFINFKNIVNSTRKKIPFGIAQIGKSFRNEITPGNFIFRTREFEQMEIEYFIDPDKTKDCPYLDKEIEDYELNIFSAEMQKKGESSQKMKIKEALKKKIIMLPWHAYWLSTELKWFESLGANMDNFRIRQHMPDEKSHYATDTWDVEYNFPFGWKELQGIADRGTFDLTQHETHSKKELRVMDEEKGKKILPMVVAEPSLGVERAFLVFMFDAYSQKGENIMLKFSPKLAPIKAAVFPLVKKDEKLVEVAKGIYKDLRKEWNIAYDESGSVGRRYARNDEIGTPFCITVDSESLVKKDVTIRNRNDGLQKRVKIKDLRETLRNLISGEVKFEDLK
jgi:glycyl-tRNA synthetase